MTWMYLPWKSKDHQIYGLSEKTIVLVRVYNQQFQGTILLTVFDLQGLFFLFLAFVSRKKCIQHELGGIELDQIRMNKSFSP